MDIKKIAKNSLNFTLNKLIEIFGILVSIAGILIFLALFTYSAEDPNFIFPDNTEIKNLLGFQGSFTSDLLFQSFGLAAYLLPITFFFTGINILLRKEFFLIIENFFYSILYLVFAVLFLNHFYKEAYTLYINGNGGFVGIYLDQTFLNTLININENIFYYILLIFVIFFFLASINFNPKTFYLIIKKIFKLIFKNNEKNYTDKSELISEYIPQEEIKNLIQEDLPFIKAEKISSASKLKFKLPTIDLLKSPSKQEREKNNDDDSNDPEFLEKILLDLVLVEILKKSVMVQL